MRILVFGAGAIGSMFGGFLSRRNDVTLLGRRRHLQAIRAKGLQVSGIWGRHTFKNLKTEWDFNRLLKSKSHFDLILVTVKSYDSLNAAKQIKRLLRNAAKDSDSSPSRPPHERPAAFGFRGATVVSIQNGLGNAEALLKSIPREQLLLGRVITGVEIPKPGAIKITVSADPVAMGRITSDLSPTSLLHTGCGEGDVVKEFSRCGIPTVGSRDIQAVLWSKVIYNCALNPLASIYNCSYGALGESLETRKIMNEVIGEIYRVAAKAKVSLSPKTAAGYLNLFYSKLLPRTYHHRPSMLQDLEKGKRTEIDSMNGALVKLGRKLGVKTPMNQTLVKGIKEREKTQRYRVPFEF